MASLGLRTIRILRKLPISAAFDVHLSQCALAYLWYDEPLSVAKVLGWTAIENSVGGVDTCDEAVQATVLASRFAKNQGRGEINDVVCFQSGTQTIH